MVNLLISLVSFADVTIVQWLFVAFAFLGVNLGIRKSMTGKGLNSE